MPECCVRTAKSVASDEALAEVKVLGMAAEKGRWIFVVIGFVLTFCFGSIYAYSVFRKPLEETWHISAMESGLPFMVFIATWTLCMAAAGGWVDRWGPRKAAFLGGALVGIGWILAGFSNDVITLTLLFGVIGGAGVGIAHIGNLTVGAKWFPDRRGLVLGLILLGLGISALIWAPIMNALIVSHGLFQTFIYSGVVLLVILILSSVPMRFPPLGWKPRNFTPSQVQAWQNIEFDRADMTRTNAFYALWVTFTIGCSGGLMAAAIAAPYGVEVVGVSPAIAALGVSMFAVFNGVGRPLFGWLTDKLTPRFAGVISFALVFAAAVASSFWGEGNVPLYFIAFSIHGLILGGWLTIAPAATATFFGTKHYGKNYGLTFTAKGAGVILGNVIAGLIRVTTGSYVPVFFPVIVLAILGGIVTFFWLKRPMFYPPY